MSDFSPSRFELGRPMLLGGLRRRHELAAAEIDLAGQWLACGDHESAHTPDFELYGPGADPLEGAGGIEVWVGVVPRIGRGD